jgi:alpha-beta hydrolase superfamily lysophospholipase
MHEPIEFRSEGATLRGRLYRPAGAPPWPLVVMAHGFTATIPMVLDRYAEAIRDTGFAALAYDHRNLGSSDGEPRREINPWVQARGYRDAVSWALARRDVDPDRIALWGDSLSAGQVLVLAALEPRVRAVVAQIAACGPEVPPIVRSPQALEAMRETLERGDVSGTPETTSGPMPVVSFDQHGTPSHLKTLTAFRWFIEYGGRYGSGWENRATRVAPPTPVPLSPWLAAPFVRCDVLMLISPDDEIVAANSAVARATFDAIPTHKELVEMDGGHFGLVWHPSPCFDQAVVAQCDFLQRRLGARR